jgi:TolA-binding protein
MNPSNNENRNIYSKMKSSLEHLNREVIATTTDLQTRIGDLLGMIHALDQKLMMAKKKNARLEKNWAHTEGSDNGSQMMIDDSKELYKMQRISNIDIILGNVLLIIVLFRVFRTSSSSMSIKQ